MKRGEGESSIRGVVQRGMTPMMTGILAGAALALFLAFCARCVDELFDNVCPNCGGGFSPRPVRPATNHHDDNWLGKYPASTARRHRPKDLGAHAELAARLRGVPVERR